MGIIYFGKFTDLSAFCILGVITSQPKSEKCSGKDDALVKLCIFICARVTACYDIVILRKSPLSTKKHAALPPPLHLRHYSLVRTFGRPLYLKGNPAIKGYSNDQGRNSCSNLKIKSNRSAIPQKDHVMIMWRLPSSCKQEPKLADLFLGYFVYSDCRIKFWLSFCRIVAFFLKLIPLRCACQRVDSELWGLLCAWTLKVQFIILWSRRGRLIKHSCHLVANLWGSTKYKWEQVCSSFEIGAEDVEESCER